MDKEEENIEIGSLIEFKIYNDRLGFYIHCVDGRSEHASCYELDTKKDRLFGMVIDIKPSSWIPSEHIFLIFLLNEKEYTWVAHRKNVKDFWKIT